MKAMMRLALLAMTALLLSGCGSDGASYLINGNKQALSVVRNKPYFWAPYELRVVVRNDPVCQRRHRMKDVNGNNVKIELYSPVPGAYILRQGKRWYVTELGSCGFQKFDEEPPQPGELLGTFLTRDGIFVFEPGKAESAGAKSGGGG